MPNLTLRLVAAMLGEAQSAVQIQNVYQAELGRAASAGEVANRQADLNNGATLGNLRTAIAQSAEATGDIEGLYQQVLGRAADAPGLAIAQATLMGGGSLSDVRSSLANSPEAAGDIGYVVSTEAGRMASAGDISYWEGQLTQGMSLAGMQTAYAYSPEVAALIQEAFQRGLGRAAGAVGLAVNQAFLNAGGSLATIRSNVFYSPEATNAIQALYQTVLGRAADAPGLAIAQATLMGGGSLSDVRSSLANSPEAAGEINYTINTEAGRAASAGDISYWEGRLSTDLSQAGIQTAFAFSAESAAQIQGLYQSVLGRAAGSTEVISRQADLNNGATLGNLRTAIAQSAEAANAIQGLYQTVLGRVADPAGLAAQQAGLAQGHSLSDLRSSFANSAEAAGDISYLVNAEVGRTASAGDISYWEGRLATDTSLAGMQTDYAYSDEASNVIQDIYQAVLGRAATASELSDRQADLNGGASLDDLRWSLVQTDEAVTDIQAVYVQVLGRTAGDSEISDRQDDLLGGQSLAGLRMSVAGLVEVAGDINAIFQAVLGRAADPTEVAAYQQVLSTNAGWTLALVAPAVVTAAVNGFYQQLFGRDAQQSEVSAFEAALANGESLQSQFAYLRPIFATGAYETGVIDQFYAGTFGVDAGLVASSGALANIEGALSAGQSLLTIEASLTPALTKGIEMLYQQDLGRAASWSDLSYWEGQIAAGQSMAAVSAAIADSPESVTHIQALWQQDFGRYASLDEVQGWQAAEASGVDPGSQFIVSTPAGTVLAKTDARTIVAETGAYVTLAGGLTPTLTAPDGTLLTFRDASEFAAYALGMACRAGQATPAALQTYDLTQSWLSQVGQVFIQAAANLRGRAVADQAAGNLQLAYVEGIGAQLAMQVQEMTPDQRQAASYTTALGQYSVTVRISGDANDPAGLGGFNYLFTDTDPGRTALIAQATAEVAAGDAAGAAGNQLLAFLDDAQARVDLAYAALPAASRTDRMLGVAQQFVDAAYQAAAQGNWNLVQTLETAADLSIKIAAEPEGQQTAMTERFVHKGTKHDITVDPNTANPFTSFKDHSKGQDVIGAIVEGVVGVVLNVLAVIPNPLQFIAIPLAVAWDTAQAGQNFADDNILGGVLSLASAAGVGLGGIGVVADGVGAAPGSFLDEATIGVGDFAESVGITDTVNALGDVTTTAAQNLGSSIQAGVALVGGATGIAQSAKSGDALGIAAGVLEVTAAIAGGLLSTGALADNPALVGIANKVAIGAGLASAAASSADAFANGDLAGGLASSLSALLSLVAQRIGQNQDTPAPPSPAVGGDDLPLPVPPVPPDYVPPALAQEDANVIEAAVDHTAANVAAGNMGYGDVLTLNDSELERSLMQQASNIEPTVKIAASAIAAIAATPGGQAFLAGLGIVFSPEILVGVGVGLITVAAAQAILNSDYLPTGPVASTNVADYDGTVLGRQSINLEVVNSQAGVGLLYNANGPGGTQLPDGHGAVVTIDPTSGQVTDALGNLVGTYANGTLTPAANADLPALIRNSPVTNLMSPLASGQTMQDGYGIVTNNDAEASLVDSMTKAGASYQQVASALDNLRNTSGANSANLVPINPFTSTDPLVGDLANKIEAMYPGLVKGVNVPLYRTDGSKATDVDIQLDGISIQVKSGGGTGLTTQMNTTAQITGQRTIAYGPNLGPTLTRNLQNLGYEVYKNEDDLLKALGVRK